MTPRKLASCGPWTGLEIVVKTDVEDYYVSESYSQGVKVSKEQHHIEPLNMIIPVPPF